MTSPNYSSRCDAAMTATSVNGLAVLADEPTKSPITDRAGNPIYWVQIRSLLLEDESIVYGCVHCDYTREKPSAVRPHLNIHKVRAPKPSTSARNPSDMSLTDLLAKVAELEKITAERDEWKRRASKAERALATMRKALRP